jgi:hypothetical protein
MSAIERYTPGAGHGRVQKYVQPRLPTAFAAKLPPKRKREILRCERQHFVLQRLRRASGPNIVQRRLWVDSCVSRLPAKAPIDSSSTT